MEIKIGEVKKAPEIDNVRLEVSKYLGGDGKKFLYKIIKTMWNMQKLPQDWELA